MGKYYYIADLHFCHANIINFDNRSFFSVDEMNRELISNWNSVITNNDTVMILGDFCCGLEDDWIKILDQLNGAKQLIKGNHDLKSMSKTLRSKFQDVKDYKEIKDNGKRVLLSYYPMPFYRGAYNPDIIHLYGHVHTTLENDFMEHLRKYINDNDHRGKSQHKCQFYNIGCMMPWMNYTPRTLDEILLATKKE